MLRVTLAPLTMMVLVTAFPALGQDSAAAGLDRLRIGFHDMGVVAVLPSPSVSGARATVAGARLTSSPDSDSPWSVRFEEMVITSEPGGWLSARSKGPAVITMGVVGAAGTREIRVDAPGLEARIGPDGPGGTVGDWSVRAPDLRVLWGDEQRATLVVARDLVYEGSEGDRTHATHEVEAAAVEIQEQWMDGAEGRGRFVAIEGLDAEVTLRSGGYLEDYPWLAAIGAGMGVDGDMRARAVTWEDRVALDGVTLEAKRSLSLGRVVLEVGHERAGLDASWSVGSLVGVDNRPAQPVRLSDGQAEGRVVVPLHAGRDVQPWLVDAEASGVMEHQDQTWPVALDVKGEGTMRVATDLHIYQAATGVSAWTPWSALFALEVLDVDTLRFSVEDGGVEASGRLERAAEVLTGGLVVESLGTLPVLDLLGRGGLLSQGASAVAVEAFQAVFGEDAGSAPKVVNLRVEEDGVLEGDRQVFAVRP